MKKIIILLFIVGLTITLVACSKNNQSPKKIDIGLMKGLLAVPYYYALDEGIFEKYQLDVELQLYNSAKDRDSAFQGNRINAVSTDLLASVLYMNSGKDIVITSKTEEQFRLVGNKNLTIDSLADIDGAKIGVSENTVIEFLVDTIMNENNITNYSKVPVSSVPDRFVEVKKGTIDMAIMPEPFPSLIISKENGIELWDNLDHDYYATCFVVDKEFAESNYGVIKSLNLAINEAITKMMDGDYEDYQDIIINHGLLQESDLSVVEEQEFHLLTNPNEAIFNQVVTWAKNKGLITKDYHLNDLLFPYQLEKLNP